MAKKKTIRIGYLVLGLLLAGGIGGGGVLGWQWLSELRCERIEVDGLRHAAERDVLELARVDTGMVLFDIDPILVADRVRRHPWVQEAEVTRLPTGTLMLKVQERTPVVMVLNRKGQGSHYLDRGGFAMPVDSGAVYDVPLLRGMREPYHPVRRVQSRQIRRLLNAVANVDEQTDALISELEIRETGNVWGYTTPVGERGSVPIRLGKSGYDEKFALLGSFWHQAVLTQPHKTFQWIDLRYDSQVVTQEHAHDQ